jgi:hypothetical protein
MEVLEHALDIWNSIHNNNLNIIKVFSAFLFWQYLYNTVKNNQKNLIWEALWWCDFELLHSLFFLSIFNLPPRIISATVVAGESPPEDPPAYPSCRKLSWHPTETSSTPESEGVGPSFSSQTWQVLDESQGKGLLLDNVEERHGS